MQNTNSSASVFSIPYTDNALQKNLLNHIDTSHSNKHYLYTMKNIPTKNKTTNEYRTNPNL